MIPKYNATFSFGLVAVFLIAINLYGAYFPDISNWGFNRWSLVPASIAIPSLVLLLILSMPKSIQLLSQFIQKTINKILCTQRKWLVLSCYFVALLAFLFVLFVLRSRALVYGDGFTVLAHISESPEELIFGQYNLQIGSVLLGRLMYSIVTPLTNVDSDTLFSLLNIIGGLGGIVAIYFIAGLLSKSETRWPYLVGTLSSGAVLLFFGHIEFYTWPLSIGLLSLFYSLRLAQNRSSSWVAIMLGVVASFLHLIALPFLAVAVLVSIWSRYRLRDIDFRLTTRIVSICAILFSIALVAISQIDGAPDVFVPFFPKPKNNYTALSWIHLRDVLNLIVYLAPLSMLFLSVPLFQRKILRTGTLESRVLGCAALFTFLPSFWIDPTLGMVRDWDLFAQFGIPLSLYVLSKQSAIAGLNSAKRWMSPLLLIAFVSIFPNIYENLSLQRSSVYLDQMLWNDPHYQSGYDNAYRGQPWGRILRKNVGLSDLSAKYFERHVASDSTAFRSWNHLGDMAQEQADYDSAIYCYEMSLKGSPVQAVVFQRLALVQDILGDSLSAEKNIMIAARLDPNSARILIAKGMILRKTGRYHEARVALKSALEYGGSADLIRYYLALIEIDNHNWDAAYYKLASCLKNNAKWDFLYEPFIETLIALRRSTEAKAAMVAWRRLNPNPELYRKYVSEIKALDST